jgi:hypothetical protein
MWVQQIRRERIWSSQTPEGQKPGMVFDNPTLSAIMLYLSVNSTLFTRIPADIKRQQV